MGFFTSNPGKILWVLGAVLVTLVKLPFLSLYYAFSRPNPKWTVRQALMNRLMRAFLYHSAVVQAKTPLNFKPGTEGDRFVTIPPVEKRQQKEREKEERLVRLQANKQIRQEKQLQKDQQKKEKKPQKRKREDSTTESSERHKSVVGRNGRQITLPLRFRD
ncbi:hypothetical protein DM02DRAFT_678163 [Periconia macrospinosa]|uniref:Uncharacterized protein n=1 Tax=Periconia macrospinosa TaxID=97972 RepID=A0A2V1D0Z6_9PLEO|nr:hypothetical protein DM02DRAFT_678163 [Periconia macrospinosa]